jgi:tetratricopeptide (TPR) repeat protein
MVSAEEKPMSDLSRYLPRLPADILALFEVTSGTMVLNVDLATFQASGQNYTSPRPEDMTLFSTINHETYHYFQTVATGYQYSYASEVWRLIGEEANAQQREREAQQANEKEEQKAVASQLRDKIEPINSKLQIPNLEEATAFEAKRYSGFQAQVQRAQMAHSWEGTAQDDLSLLAAELPSLAEGLGQLWKKITSPGVLGLSAEHLIEGSAVVFQHLLTHGIEGLESRLAHAWDETGKTYRKAFDIARELCGARALEIILPATALALRYAKPPEAYVVFLEKLKAGEPGKEIATARALALDPLGITEAGEYLGTASDVRSKQAGSDNRYPVYDDVLDKLEQRAWGFDEIDLLSDRNPAFQINNFPFVVIVKEGIIQSNLDPTLLTKRVMCASLVLRTEKLPKYRRAAEQRIVERLHPVIASLVNPKLAAEEYLQLGIKYLKEDDADQAEIVLDRALHNYMIERDVQGAGWATYNMGVVYGDFRRDWTKAEETYRAALDAGESVKDDRLTAWSATGLGDVYMKVDRLHEAETLTLKALAITERLDDKATIALCCWNLARIYFAWKQRDEVRKFSLRAVDLYRMVGNQKMVKGLEAALADMDRNAEQQPGPPAGEGTSPA